MGINTTHLSCDTTQSASKREILTDDDEPATMLLEICLNEKNLDAKGVKRETRGETQKIWIGTGVFSMEFVPRGLEENFGEYIDYLDDHELAEELQYQESVLESLQNSTPPDLGRSTSSSNVPELNDVHAQSMGERVSSRTARPDSHIDNDAALARTLQELEFRDQHRDNSSESDANSESDGSNGERISSAIPQARWQGGVDPDNMSYEELQELGETVGTQNRGLSDELISYLPSSSYRTGFFSRNNKHEECIICCQTYANRDKLTSLPCKHRYHKDCITNWLKINKTCPVCTKEVFGSR